MSIRSSAAFAFGVLSLFLAAGFASAQTAGTTNVEGVVTDSTGAVLPGVSVVVRNMDTNVVRETTTDSGGRYRAGALQPGRYEVSVSLSGFESKRTGDVPAHVGDTATVDFQLRPAGMAEEVTVTGESPLVDNTRTDVSNVVSRTAIENLPINGRRWENFVLLSPGVTNDGGFGLVSYRGISGLYNNNTVDGVDNNQAFFSEARGRTRASYTISQAAIREFQVGISNFSAEFGRAAGGTVNAVTKSGTNEVSGEAFYFLRDDSFQSKDPFASFKPSEKRQQFGASVGGPLKKDKAFFFINYDQQLRNFPYFVRTSSPTFTSQPCTAPGCAATLNWIAAETGPAVPREGNNRILLGKVDIALNKDHNLSLQYNRHRWRAPNGIRTPAINFNAASDNGLDIVRTDFGLLTLNSVLGPRFLNELRLQLGRDFEAQEPNVRGPGTSVTNGFSFGMPNFLPRPKYPDEKRYQFLDNVSFYRGNHSIKIGADINYVREDIINLFQGGGIYSYANLQNLASDCPPAATGCVPLQDATTGRHYTSFTQAFDLRPGLAGDAFFTTTDYNFFVQDNWKVTKELMLNLGLRYEYQQLPQPGKAKVKGIVFTGNPAFPASTHFNQDKNNFGPRLGFTYDVGARHETVVRGGFGVYYGRTSNSVLFTALTNNAVTTATYVFNPSTAGAPAYPAVLSAPPSIPGTRPSISTLSPGLQRPEIYMGDFTVERSLGHDVTVSASYLFSKGKKLPLFIDTNLPGPNAQVTYVGPSGSVLGTLPFFRGTRADLTVGRNIEVRSDAESTYNGLVLQVNKRVSKGLLFNANYTLSKSTDLGQNSTTFIPTFSNVVNPLELAAEEGTSAFDRRHRFVTSLHYAPDWLWGVQIGGVGTFESGLPLTATIAGGVAAATGGVDTSTTNGSGGDNRVPFLERNGFRQSGRKTIDLRLSKSFDLGGRRKLVALWEGFNVFNWVNYTGFSAIKYRVGSSAYDAGTNTVTVNLTEDSGFLLPNSASNTLFGPRDMQVGIKVLW
jgi:Carboxypeptidase regulatory-like domain/TonB dependent receptor-like, beta-barrel